MNANQQTLNLTTMQNDKRRIPNKETSIRWINFLNSLKQEADNNNVTNLYSHLEKHAVNAQWGVFLKNNNIIFRNSDYLYKWNDKIPVSKKLIDSFRVYQMELSMKYNPERYKNPKIIKPIRKIKLEVSDKAHKIVRETLKNTNTQELGLIRKFLKWIY